MATSGRLPECSIRLRTSLPHDRPANRASMSQTSTKGSCHKGVLVGRELLYPSMRSPNSSTERNGSCRLLSRLLVAAWASTTLTPSYMAHGISKAPRMSATSDDSERRGVEDADGTAGVDDAMVLSFFFHLIVFRFSS